MSWKEKNDDIFLIVIFIESDHNIYTDIYHLLRIIQGAFFDWSHQFQLFEDGKIPTRKVKVEKEFHFFGRVFAILKNFLVGTSQKKHPVEAGWKSDFR